MPKSEEEKLLQIRLMLRLSELLEIRGLISMEEKNRLKTLIGRMYGK